MEGESSFPSWVKSISVSLDSSGYDQRRQCFTKDGTSITVDTDVARRGIQTLEGMSSDFGMSTYIGDNAELDGLKVLSKLLSRTVYFVTPWFQGSRTYQLSYGG